MRKHGTKAGKGRPPARSTPPKGGGAPPRTNEQLARQTRRILGKHYANRYGKR